MKELEQIGSLHLMPVVVFCRILGGVYKSIFAAFNINMYFIISVTFIVVFYTCLILF